MDFRSIEHSPDWYLIKLSLLPDFLAKHQASHQTVHIPRTFHLQCLNSEGPEELTLCPVRALRQYLKITQNHRSNRRSIFLSISTKSTKSLSANTISWWIKYLIRLAYSSASSETLKELQIPEGEPSLFRATHEIRALSSTLSWMRHTSSISDILCACYWRQHTAFTHSYLRNASAVKDDSLVIASRVIC